MVQKLEMDMMMDINNDPTVPGATTVAVSQFNLVEEAHTLAGAEGQQVPQIRKYRTRLSFSQSSPGKTPPLYRLCSLMILITTVLPLLYELPWIHNARPSVLGAQASLVKTPRATEGNFKREDTPTDVCNRWSHQSAVVNGTLYVYGGRSIQSAGQTQNTWNNDFLSLPLNEGWDISSPKLKGLPRPSGPPAVSNGYLWHSYDSLFLFGGMYSESPFKPFDPYSLWEYDIKSSSWKEHKDPKTSAGVNSEDGNQPIQQAAEGAGISIPELGRGWYFGGHLDHYTTPGWSIQVARVYLKSLIEFTFPGYRNDAVECLQDGKTAGEHGVWRNITQGGIQNTNTFPNRADGVLVHVPGFGESGIILSLAGGNNETFVSAFGLPPPCRSVAECSSG